jgi:pimeloyl-ACP methyl ester carboxylesterase
MNNRTQFVNLADGRKIAYAEYGDPKGIPTLYCHGFPGSRLEALLFDGAARRHKLRVIAPDRNGIGLSDACPERQIVDWPYDVTELLDHLEIERFYLIGVSGGCPYALAYAAQFASRLYGVTIVCPLAPFARSALVNCMHWPARVNFKTIRRMPLISKLVYRHLVVPLTQLWPQTIYQLMLAIAPPPDANVLRRSQVRSILCGSIHEAVQQGSDSILHEMLLYTLPWGFELSGISIPVQLWHGNADETVPILHGHALAELLPNCDTHFVDAEGHFSLPIDRADQILQHLLSRR